MAEHIEPYWSKAQEDVAIIAATDEPPVIVAELKAVKK